MFSMTAYSITHLRTIQTKLKTFPIGSTSRLFAYLHLRNTLTYLLTFLILSTSQLASCLINAQPLPAHLPAADDNFLIGCTSHELTDDWSLASTHFVDSLYPFRCSFGCVLLSNQIYLTTMNCSTIPLRFI